MSPKKNSRMRRDERSPNPPPIRLTTRDIAILESVYQCRVLTTQHLQKLYFPSLHQAYARLSALYHHGLLDRHFMGVYFDKMNTPIMYILDKRGAEILQAERGIEPDWTVGAKDVTHTFLEHTLAINDVRVAITATCSQSPNFELLQWRSENDLKADYDRVTIQLETGKWQNISLIPDSYFVLSTPNGKSHCFLELDRGTMTLKRFKQKVLAYQQYYRTGLYQERYQTKSLRVLTVTTSQARSENLKKATEEAQGQQRFWFTTLNQIAQSSILYDPIWQIATLNDAQPLVSLQE